MRFGGAGGPFSLHPSRLRSAALVTHGVDLARRPETGLGAGRKGRCSCFDKVSMSKGVLAEQSFPLTLRVLTSAREAFFNARSIGH